MTLLRKIVRLYHTVKYLKAKQVIWRGINLLPRFVSEVQNHPKVIEEQIEKKNIARKGITFDYQSFTFLSETHKLNQVGWDNP